MMGFFKIIKKLFIFLMRVVLVLALLLLGTNVYVRLKSNKRIIELSDTANVSDVDCIMVLGASIKHGDTPSLMLADRLDCGIEVYNTTGCKLLMSGDRTDDYYDEVAVMRAYAEERGVPADAIIDDPEGFSTYESMYRAKNVYGVKKMIIVTQRYHLYRALYIARELGIEAYGVATEDATYHNQYKRDIREVLAISKDFFKVIFKPET